jgi:hypothetical protein
VATKKIGVEIAVALADDSPTRYRRENQRKRGNVHGVISHSSLPSEMQHLVAERVVWRSSTADPTLVGTM